MFLSMTSSFWSFIVSRWSLILLLSNISSSEGLFRYCTSISKWVFRHMSSYWSVWSQTFPLMFLLCMFWLYWGLCLIYSSSFWKVFCFLLFIFSVSNNNILYLKFAIYLVISEVLLHFQCFNTSGGFTIN